MVSNRHLLFQGSILRGELIYFQVYDMVTSQNTLPNRQPKEARWGSSRQSLQTVKHLNKRPSSLSRKDHLLNQLPLGVNIPFFQTVSKSIGFQEVVYLHIHPPRGGVWTLRGRLVAPITIHLAPLGGSRYAPFCFFMVTHIVLTCYHFSKVFVPKLYSQISLGNLPFFPRPEASTLAQRWIDLRSGFGSSSHRATGTEHLAPLGRVIFFAGKSGDGTDETKKKWGLDFLGGCFGVFFVVFRVVFMLEGFFCGGIFVGVNLEENWMVVSSLFSMLTLIWALIFSNGLKMHKKSWWELQHHFSSPYRIPGLVLMYLHVKTIRINNPCRLVTCVSHCVLKPPYAPGGRNAPGSWQYFSLFGDSYQLPTQLS